MNETNMQNTIEKGMKIHPVGTLVAVLACMLVFYVCNFIVMKFSKKSEEDLTKEIKQRVEEVKLAGHMVNENEMVDQRKVENLKATEKDIEMARKEKIKTRMTAETKQIPVLVKT